MPKRIWLLALFDSGIHRTTYWQKGILTSEQLTFLDHDKAWKKQINRPPANHMNTVNMLGSVMLDENSPAACVAKIAMHSNLFTMPFLTTTTVYENLGLKTIEMTNWNTNIKNRKQKHIELVLNLFLNLSTSFLRRSNSWPFSCPTFTSVVGKLHSIL